MDAIAVQIPQCARDPAEKVVELVGHYQLSAKNTHLQALATTSESSNEAGPSVAIYTHASEIWVVAQVDQMGVLARQTPAEEDLEAVKLRQHRQGLKWVSIAVNVKSQMTQVRQAGVVESLRQSHQQTGQVALSQKLCRNAGAIQYIQTSVLVLAQGESVHLPDMT